MVIIDRKTEHGDVVIRNRRWAGAILLACMILPLAGAAAAHEPSPQPVAAPDPWLGEAPRYPDLPPPAGKEERPGIQSAAGGFGFLDLSSRHLSRAFYNIVFSASENVGIGWTGDVGICDPGTTSTEFKDAVLTRIQYFRAMAGVPSDTVLNATYSADAQEAALMMSANDALDHTPPPDWSCYTAAGAEAAGNSNLSIGSNGWDAVFGQMKDYGSGNAAVGHRRWILYPQTQAMGSGDIAGSNGDPPDSNALWVFDSNLWGARPAVRDTFVAWPPAGHVPYNVVFPRWSFSYPDADFSGATVTMTRDGSNVPVVQEIVATGFGEPTLVWVPEGLDPNNFFSDWPMPVADATYQVTVSNFTAGGGAMEQSYEVTVFDPSVAGGDEISPEISGNSQVQAGVPETYSYTLIDWVSSYELRQSNLAAHTAVEGAENGLGAITDGTDGAYDLITSDTRASGIYSFHLAHPAPQDQYFTLPETLFIGSGSTLNFESRLGWATAGQVAKAQISLDGGASWIDLYSQAGSGSAGDPGFNARSVSLGAYQNRTAEFRFFYDYQGGSYYPQTSDGVGFYVDDIEVTNAYTVNGETTVDIGGTGDFAFTAAAAGTYGLQVRGVPWPDFSGLEWSSLFMVEASEDAPACSGDMLALQDQTYSAGVTDCTATTSISTAGIVSVLSGATLNLTAPSVHLGSGFSAAAGSIVTIRNSAP